MHPCGVHLRVAGSERIGDPLAGREREVDSFARDRIDEACGVTGERPARSADSELAEIARGQRRDRPRVRIETRASRDARRANPLGGARAQVAGGEAGVGLRADANRQVIGPRKRPDVPRRVAGQLDDDLVARDAAREEAGGDRELVAPERPRDAAAHETVRTVGANHEIGAARARDSVDLHAVLIDRHISDAHALDDRASPLSRREKRRIERRAARDDERAAI